jgi:hypothetical protein
LQEHRGSPFWGVWLSLSDSKSTQKRFDRARESRASTAPTGSGAVFKSRICPSCASPTRTRRVPAPRRRPQVALSRRRQESQPVADRNPPPISVRFLRDLDAIRTENAARCDEHREGPFSGF